MAEDSNAEIFCVSVGGGEHPEYELSFDQTLQIAVAIGGSGFNESVVNQVLGIAAFTNGPILGIFLLGVLTKRVREKAALIGLGSGIAFMTAVQFVLPGAIGLTIAWPWYVLIGSSVTFGVGYIASVAFDPAQVVDEPVAD